MNKIMSLTGVAAAALATVAMAAPAEAQRYDRYDRYYGRDRGIDAGDIFAGVAILGGIAAITSAISRDSGRYGYGVRERYRYGYQAAVNSCAYQAERAGRGRVRIQDVDRIGDDRFRVRGVVENAYNGYHDRYDRYDRYDRGYGYNRSHGERFTCTARGNGRVTAFRLNDYAYGGYRY